MKNKSVMTLGITILLSIGLTACSNSREIVNNDAAEAMAEVTSTTESVTIEETEAESLTEETTESVDIEDSSIEETTEIEGSTVEESSIEEMTEESTYTISELSQTMYATTNCRVRKGPSTDDEVVSTLDKGEEVEVTGKVNEVNWYEIVIDGEKEYVSGSLLSDTKPAEESIQATQTTQPSTPSQVENTQPSTPPSSTGAPINPITGKQMELGESYVDPTDGVTVQYISSSERYK